MSPLALVAIILNGVVLLYVIVLFARLVLEWIPVFNREWRPRGVLLVLAEAVYTITDPPIRFFRRILPPVRLGPVALDLGFALTMILCFVLLSVTRVLASYA